MLLARTQLMQETNQRNNMTEHTNLFLANNGACCFLINQKGVFVLTAHHVVWTFTNLETVFILLNISSDQNTQQSKYLPTKIPRRQTYVKRSGLIGFAEAQVTFL